MVKATGHPTLLVYVLPQFPAKTWENQLQCLKKANKTSKWCFSQASSGRIQNLISKNAMNTLYIYIKSPQANFFIKSIRKESKRGRERCVKMVSTTPQPFLISLCTFISSYLTILFFSCKQLTLRNSSFSSSLFCLSDYILLKMITCTKHMMMTIYRNKILGLASYRKVQIQ